MPNEVKVEIKDVKILTLQYILAHENLTIAEEDLIDEYYGIFHQVVWLYLNGKRLTD